MSRLLWPIPSPVISARLLFIVLSSFSILTIILGICLLDGSLHLTYFLRFLTNTSVLPTEYSAIAPAMKTYDVHGTAYVFLALGAQAHTLSCPASIESLVRFTGWSGHVYMFTDRPSCFDKESIVQNAGMNAEKMHVHVVTDDFSSGGVDGVVGFRKSRVLAKAMKTRIFDEIKDQSIHTIVYADCDILFGIEGCTSRFITEGSQWNETNIKFGRLRYSDDSEAHNYDPYTQKDAVKMNLKFVDIHSGTFVAHRQYSKEVMSIWEREMNTLQYVSFMLKKLNLSYINAHI